MNLAGRTWALAAHPEGGSQTPGGLPAGVCPPLPRPPGKTGRKVAARLPVPVPGASSGAWGWAVCPRGLSYCLSGRDLACVPGPL